MILERVIVGPMAVNCYILASSNTREAVIIDPGSEESKIRNVLKSHNLTAKFIINTHGHYDHIGENDKFAVPVYVHKFDYPMLKDPMLNLSGLFSSPHKTKAKIELLDDGQIISLDEIRMKVIHTPGHTKGGITLVMESPVENIAFTGDTLFCEGVGRSDLPGGDEEELRRSIRDRIFNLPGQTRVYPGHGDFSTVADEEKNNLI